jgi:hypothetical protein
MQKYKNQSGAIHTLPLLLIIASVGLISFLLISSTAPIGGFFGNLFNKPSSFAATDTISVAIDANTSVHPISPYIYGTATSTDAYQKTMGASITRWGGNQVSRYNWETNDSNSGVDWGLCLQPYLNRSYGAFSNVIYTQGSPGISLKNSVTAGKTQNMDFLFTVPNVGWVAKDGNNNTCSTNVPGSDGPPLGSLSNDEAAISGYDPNANRNTTSVRSQMKKSSAFVYPPSTTDGIVYQDELINWLTGQVGKASQGGVKFYAFDNEFDLWSSTHRDIHPAQVGYDALWNKFSTFANAVKDVDATALVTGPVHWGWIAYWNSQLGASDRQAHGNLPLDEWFLQQAKNTETQTGRRILDVLDVHYYPQAGQYSSDDTATMQALRLRSTRELWDPTYATESWQTCCEGGPNLQIIRRLKSWVNTDYPGTKLGITEWNWGDDDHINGGLTIADILGIFGREDVYLANYWTTPADQTPGYWAWRMYRNYDGAFSRFGDTSVSASTASTNVDKISIYGSKDSTTGELKIMAINKQPSNDENTTFSLTNFVSNGTAKVYRYSQADTTKINQLTNISGIGSSFSYDLTPYSITLFVISPGSGLPSPTPSPTIAPSPTPVLTPTPKPTTTPSASPNVCNGADVNKNGSVDLLDYSVVISNFGKSEPAGTNGDINGNGNVDLLDYSVVISNFGKTGC